MTDGDLLSFGPFLLDTRARTLTRDGERVSVVTRHFDVLQLFVLQPGKIHTKAALTDAGWPDMAVGDHSVEQAIFHLRHALRLPSGASCIQTHPRRGYRFVAEVTRVARRESDETLDAMLDTNRAWIEGRAALETLDAAAIVRARATFERVVAQAPDQASAHVGLANACALQFELTRTDASPDRASLTAALTHAQEACRLAPHYGEAWATLGFVLERVGRRDDALAALRHATALEPGNWMHHLRLSSAAWGEERLRAARRTLQLLPGLAMAHWLVATVLVARGAFAEAERELRIGLEESDDTEAPARFSAVALHWLLGLLLLAQGDTEQALTEFQRELQLEPGGHLYARECAANTWYATGAARFRAGDAEGARAAWLESLRRVPMHPLAHAALGRPVPAASGSVIDRLVADVVAAIAAGASPGEAGLTAALQRGLAEAPSGNGGWWIPIEPMLTAASHPTVWKPLLRQLCRRAA